MSDRITQTRRLLASASESFAGAHWATTAAERLVATRLGALRTAAAVLAARGSADSVAAAQRPVSVWQVLERVAPELGEWADYFTRTLPQGWDAPALDPRLVDDLLRAGEDFLHLASSSLGLPHPPLPTTLAPIVRGGAVSAAASGGLDVQAS